MAYAPQTTRAQGGTSLDYGLTGLWANLSARFAWHRNYRRTIEELQMLSDRELGDLGIHRSQIREIAREAADRS